MSLVGKPLAGAALSSAAFQLMAVSLLARANASRPAEGHKVIEEMEPSNARARFRNY